MKIKNNTGVNQTWVGQVIGAGMYYEIDPLKHTHWAYDSALVESISAGDAIVNTETGDITGANDAIILLQAVNANCIKGVEIDDSAKADQSSLIYDSATDKIIYGAAGSIFGQNFQTLEDNTESSTSSTSYLEKLSITTPSLPSGTYRIGWHYNWNPDQTGFSFQAQVQLDNTTQIMYHEQGVPNIVSDTRIITSGFVYKTLSGITQIDLDYKSALDGKTVRIRDTRLEIWRVS